MAVPEVNLRGLATAVARLEQSVQALNDRLDNLDARLKPIEKRVLSDGAQTLCIGHWTLCEALHEGQQLLLFRYHPRGVDTSVAPSYVKQSYLSPISSGLIATQFLGEK